MKHILKLIRKDTLFLLLVIFMGVLASRTLLFQSGYFNMHDDLQMMRQLQMEKCFQDGQVPCRWVPDMAYGFGFPLFNFYPPFPYLVGQLFRLFGFTFVTTAKITFSLSIILSGVTMYYLAKEFFGRWGGLIASAFYIWAPYHAVDVYVRGAMNEAWALTWFPVILWTSYRLVTDDKKKAVSWTIALGLSFAGLMLSHNLMLLVFTPVLAIWTLLHLVLNKSWRRIPHLVAAGFISLGLSAFFTFPAILENKFTQIESTLVGYYDYTVHFATIRQLLTSRFWGHGPSVWLDEDGMPFQIGHLHWLLSILVGVIAFGFLIGYLKKPKLFEKVSDLKTLLVAGLMVSMGWFAAFLAHSKSTPIWKLIPQLGYMQFPWRFLALVILGFSFSVGFVPYILENLSGYRSRVIKFLTYPFRVGLVILVIIVLIAINWSYFLPEHGKMGPLTDEQKFSDLAWELQQTSSIYDYLPSTAKTAPKSAMEELFEVMDGEVEIIDLKQGTDWAEMRVNVLSENATARLGIIQFPNWKTYIDDKEVANYIPNTEEWGRIYVDMTQGEHVVDAVFTNTPVRTVSNLVSLVTWIGLIVFVLYLNRERLPSKS